MPDKSEAEELVRVMMRNMNEKEPLLKTLNKYVKVVRTEHCFLIFEQLGKSDKWLQCLEVCFYNTLLCDFSTILASGSFKFRLVS